MAKIEKTLELNITHEILSLADSFWWYLQPMSLKRYWRPSWRFPLIPQPKSFATGLHINLEGRKGGGYDVCINSPSSFRGRNPRLLFMQFKAGINNNGLSDPKSKFSTHISNPNKHIEFSINDNGAKIKQHQLLHDLAKKIGKESAVVYVFPQIIDQDTLIENIGNLLKKTLFISIKEIEDKASAKGYTLLDGNPHTFRLCYDNLYKSEVNFFFFDVDKIQYPGGVLGEIFAIRTFRALQALGSTQEENLPILTRHIKEALLRHIYNIAYYFSITPATLESILNSNEDLDIEMSYDFLDDYKVYFSNNIRVAFNVDVATDIINNIAKYYSWADSLNEFTRETIIPIPPSSYSIELTEENLRFSVENNDYSIQDFEDITYQLF